MSTPGLHVLLAHVQRAMALNNTSFCFASLQSLRPLCRHGLTTDMRWTAEADAEAEAGRGQDPVTLSRSDCCTVLRRAEGARADHPLKARAKVPENKRFRMSRSEMKATPVSWNTATTLSWTFLFHMLSVYRIVLSELTAHRLSRHHLHRQHR